MSLDAAGIRSTVIASPRRSDAAWLLIILALLVTTAPTGPATAQGYGGYYYDEPSGGSIDPGGGGGQGSPPDDVVEVEHLGPARSVEVTLSPDPVPVPARGEAPVGVTVSVHAWGDKGPLAGARVRLSVTGGSGFVQQLGGFTMSQPQLSSGGSWSTTVYVSNPVMDDLRRFPQQLVVHVSLSDPEGGGHVGSGSARADFDVIRISGTTVGPGDPPLTPDVMTPRQEPPPATNWRRNFIHATSDHRGNFFVLVKRPRKETDLRVVWPDTPGCHLPLEFPLKIEPASPFDVRIDRPVELLSPQEHERRIKHLVARFLDGMILKPAAAARVKGRLQRLPFEADASLGSAAWRPIPVYDWVNAIKLPAASLEAFWATSLDPDREPPYTMIFHELGHFVHHQLVETSQTSWWFHSRGKTQHHDTWTPPGQHVQNLAVQYHTSFAEATAELFALLVTKEIRRSFASTFVGSSYFRPGYLRQFETPGAEQRALHWGGCRVEGVQVRFLVSYYAGEVTNRPAVVYNDFLATMWRPKQESWVSRISHWAAVPARTINDWVSAKRKYGGLVNAAIDELTGRFHIEPCLPPRRFLASGTGGDATLEISGQARTIGTSFPGAPMDLGTTLRVTGGRLVLDWDPPTDTVPVLVAETGAEIRLVSTQEVLVLAGKVKVVDFNAKSPRGGVTIRTAGDVIALPKGTVYTVEVATDGHVQVQVLEGEVEVTTPTGRGSVPAGREVTVAPGGVVGPARPLTVAPPAWPAAASAPPFQEPPAQHVAPVITSTHTAPAAFDDPWQRPAAPTLPTPTRGAAPPAGSWSPAPSGPAPTPPSWRPTPAPVAAPPTPVPALPEWTGFPGAGGCFGGRRCGGNGRVLAIPLEPFPVTGIRFRAHDDVGDLRGGRLRVRVGGRQVEHEFPVPDQGSSYSFDAPGLRGDQLVFEAVGDDEVVVTDVGVRYDRSPQPVASGSWHEHRAASQCIGGRHCSQNGRRITVLLDGSPVSGVRLRVSDAVGERHDGRLRVRLDGQTVAEIDVPSQGRLFVFEVPAVRAMRLILETTTNDEVMIQDVAVRTP